MNRVVSTYVQALYGAAIDASLSPENLMALETNLTRISTAVQISPELRSILKNPSVTNEEKLAVLKKLLTEDGSVPIVLNFLGLLSHKSRFEILGAIGDAFTEVRLESQGGLLGIAESAEPLQDSELRELSASFEKKLGKKVFFKTKIDPNLLAGVKVTVNGVTYDGTVRSQLNQLRDRLALSH